MIEALAIDEGETVGPDWEGELTGFDACPACYLAWCCKYGVDA